MTKDRLAIVRIVDDNDEYRNSETFLLRMFGYNVADYSSALDFLEKDDPAIPGCLILDVKMPEMSGLELQKVMTEKELGLPIIFLTGHGDVEMAVNTLHRGASDFLLKPVAPERLKESVARAIEADRNNRAKKRIQEEAKETNSQNEKKMSAAWWLKAFSTSRLRLSSESRSIRLKFTGPQSNINYRSRPLWISSTSFSK